MSGIAVWGLSGAMAVLPWLDGLGVRLGALFSLATICHPALGASLGERVAGGGPMHTPAGGEVG